MSELGDVALYRKVSRYLDGEMDEAERADFERRLVRDGRARRLVNQVAGDNRAAAEALRAAVGAGETRGSGDVSETALRAPARRRWTGRLRLWAGVAAAILIAVGAWLAVTALHGTGDRRKGAETVGSDVHARAADVSELTPREKAKEVGIFMDPPFRLLGEDPSRSRRSVERYLYGILDEENKRLYVLERNQTSTKVQTVGMDL
jgi:hypothetical protein